MLHFHLTFYYKNPEGKKQLCEELVKQELIIQDCYNRKLNESEAFVKEFQKLTKPELHIEQKMVPYSANVELVVSM